MGNCAQEGNLELSFICILTGVWWDAVMGLEVSQTWGSTAGRLSGAGVGWAGRRGKTGHSEVEGEGERQMVACSFWRISLPSRGTRQEGIMRNKWEKGKPSSLQVRGRVTLGEEEIPSIPVTVTGEVRVGPE